MKVKEILAEFLRVLCIIRPRCTFCFTKKKYIYLCQNKYKQGNLLQEDVLLHIAGNENNREALRELLPDKWAKKSN